MTKANEELNIASNFCDSYARNLSYNDETAPLKHSLKVACRVLVSCDLKIYKKNDGFVFSIGTGRFGYLSPFEGLLWRFFKVIPKRLFPYSIKGKPSNWKSIDSAPRDRVWGDMINLCRMDFLTAKWQKLRILEHDSLDAAFIKQFTMTNIAKVLNSLAEKGFEFTLQEFRQTGDIVIIKTANPEPPKDENNESL